MKILFLSFIMGGFLSYRALAETTASNLTEEAHAGPERSFSDISDAVVEVRTQYGYGTGTLFLKDGSYYVLTAAHVIASFGDQEISITVKNAAEEQPAIPVYVDSSSDIAILSVGEMSTRTALKLKFRRNSIEVGDRAGYCGFPNRRDLQCFSGMVSRSTPDVVNLHSYAWMGASGSLVVDRRGRVIGILSALEVGRFFGLPQAIEDLVWIRPISSEILESL